MIAGLLIALHLLLHAARGTLLMLLGQQCCAMPPQGHMMIVQRQHSYSLSFLLHQMLQMPPTTEQKQQILQSTEQSCQDAAIHAWLVKLNRLGSFVEASLLLMV
jgi:hypothetical protein